MLDVRRLILLRELEARGSIAAVSRAIGISSSAISQQLAKLEADVGMSLLEQIGRNVRLTDIGQKLARRGNEVLAILEEAESEIESRRTRVQGSVRLVTFGTFALRYLPDVLRRLAASHPDVVVNFDQVEPVEALDAVSGRRADIAVIDEYPNTPRRVDPQMASIYLLRDHIDAYLPVEVDSVRGLADIPWVFEPADSDASAWARRMCRDAGFEPQVRFESPDLRLHHGLVAAGLAAALIPRMVFLGPTAPLSEPSVRFEWPPAVRQELHRDVYAVTRRGAHSRPALAAVLKHLQASASDHPARDLDSP
jgi:DNA-binding transcriptional LysR family regulator